MCLTFHFINQLIHYLVGFWFLWATVYCCLLEQKFLTCISKSLRGRLINIKLLLTIPQISKFLRRNCLKWVVFRWTASLHKVSNRKLVAGLDMVQPNVINYISFDKSCRCLRWWLNTKDYFNRLLGDHSKTQKQDPFRRVLVAWISC